MASDQMIGIDASGIERPMRSCSGLGVGCGQIDDHPRHVIDVPGSDEEVQYHLDCHAAMGCESCTEQVKGRPKNATGAAMLDHIIAGASTAPQADDAASDDTQEG